MHGLLLFSVLVYFFLSWCIALELKRKENMRVQFERLYTVFFIVRMASGLVSDHFDLHCCCCLCCCCCLYFSVRFLSFISFFVSIFVYIYIEIKNGKHVHIVTSYSPYMRQQQQQQLTILNIYTMHIRHNIIAEAKYTFLRITKCAYMNLFIWKIFRLFWSLFLLLLCSNNTVVFAAAAAAALKCNANICTKRNEHFSSLKSIGQGK